LKKLTGVCVRYGVAVLATVMGFTLRHLVVGAYDAAVVPYVTLLPAVMLTAIFAGLGPAFVATACAAALADYFILPPHGFGIARPQDAVGLALFCAMSVGMTVVAELYRRKRREAREYRKTLAFREVREQLQNVSEQRRLMLEAAGLGAWDYHFAAGEIFWDDHCRDMFGVAAGQRIDYQEALACIHPDDRESVDAAVNRTLAGHDGGAFHREFRVVWPDGSLHWIQSHGRAYFRGTETLGLQPQRFIGINMEITEAKGFQQAICDREKELAAIYDNAPMVMMVVDRTLRVRKTNKAAKRLVGDWGQVFGPTMGSALPCVYAPGTPDSCGLDPHCGDCVLRRAVLTSFETGAACHSVELELRLLREGRQQPATFLLSTAVLDLHDQREVLVTLLDVTDRKRAEQALIRSEKVASAGRMAATVAHEINNPLAAAMNSVFIAISSGELPAATRLHLEDADAELRRISHLTRQALGFYREHTSAASVDLVELMGSAVGLLKNQIEAKHAQVETDLAARAEVNGVAGELRQVFINLLANSLEAIEPGGTIKIRISGNRALRNGTRGVRVTVADDGKGIAEGVLPHIFEPLYTTKEMFGTGLGLWITKQLVERHGGSLRVRSRAGGPRSGCVFSLVLPGTEEPVAARWATAS
jgi:signal transduction histidine kinase